MAGVDILCSAKRDCRRQPHPSARPSTAAAAKDPQDCILARALASRNEDRDRTSPRGSRRRERQQALKSCKPVKFVPFDPVSKRTEATVTDANGSTITVTKGAPQAIVDLVKPAADIAQRVKQTVDGLAAKGSRALAVARSE